MPEIKIYKSRWKAIRLLLLTSPFVGFSIFDLLNKNHAMPVWFSWFSLCFFGLGIPVAIFHLFDRRPQIIINEKGIFDRMAYKDFINWRLINDAYLVDVSKQKFICLVISDEAIQLLKKKTSFKLSKQMGFQEINLSLGQIKIDEKKFLGFILAMSKAESEDQGYLIENYEV